MRVFDTFAIRGAGGLDRAKELVASALGITLAAHDSGYRGGLYYRGELPDGGTAILQNDPDAVALDDCSLFVEGATQPDATRAQLERLAHVRHVQRDEVP